MSRPGELAFNVTGPVIEFVLLANGLKMMTVK